ncbi:MAG: glycosyltransferase [Eubacteriales bacterium]|nr:glycosyltransferase [Lachnospiraceae bacterium]MDO5126347.1 glycosyltransferase [Eubacteriales bacterium]
MKKVLMLATTAAMIEQFNKSNILILEEMGYTVDVAGNFDEGNPISQEKLNLFKTWLEEHGAGWYNLPATRKPTDLKNNRRALKMVISLIKENHYEFIHCHTPLGSVIGRFAAHKTKTPIIYTAHGFHFFKGAPIKNWLIYYPIEWFCSFMTDLLITINKEDFKRANRHLHAKDVKYIPGVGVDIPRFQNCVINKEAYIREFNFPEDAFVLLSVGELMERKNQIVIIEALHKLNNPNIYYLAVGQGHLQKLYESKICEYHLENQIKLLGFRDDVDRLCKYANCFVHPSIREGLGIAPLEAMASGMPLISANINGMKDYTAQNKTGFCIHPTEVDEMANAIDYIYKHPEFAKACGTHNQKVVKKYDIAHSKSVMRDIYATFIKTHEGK